MEWFNWLWAMPEVRFLVCQILLNTTVAIAAAISTGTFELRRVSDFLYRKVLPLVLTFAVARLVEGATSITWIDEASLILIESRLISDLVDNLVKLGIKVPPGGLAILGIRDRQ